MNRLLVALAMTPLVVSAAPPIKARYHGFMTTLVNGNSGTRPHEVILTLTEKAHDKIDIGWKVLNVGGIRTSYEARVLQNKTDGKDQRIETLAAGKQFLDISQQALDAVTTFTGKERRVIRSGDERGLFILHPDDKISVNRHGKFQLTTPPHELLIHGFGTLKLLPVHLE